MVTFEECAQMLDEIADGIPYELYRELNGGISIVPQVKYHPVARRNDLYILGEYRRDLIGNSIVFYYGSIARVYGSLPRAEFYQKMVHILHHEVRRHRRSWAVGRRTDNKIPEKSVALPAHFDAPVLCFHNNCHIAHKISKIFYKVNRKYSNLIRNKN